MPLRVAITACAVLLAGCKKSGGSKGEQPPGSGSAATGNPIDAAAEPPDAAPAIDAAVPEPAPDAATAAVDPSLPRYLSLSVHGPRDRDEVDKELEATWIAKWQPCFAGSETDNFWEITFKVAADGKMTVGTIETTAKDFEVKSCLARTLTAPFAGTAKGKTEILVGMKN